MTWALLFSAFSPLLVSQVGTALLLPISDSGFESERLRKWGGRSHVPIPNISRVASQSHAFVLSVAIVRCLETQNSIQKCDK